MRKNIGAKGLNSRSVHHPDTLRYAQGDKKAQGDNLPITEGFWIQTRIAYGTAFAGMVEYILTFTRIPISIVVKNKN